MSTARKYTFNNALMSVQSRRRSYAAINIMWLQMRPDLAHESKDDIRDERLAWISDFLGLKKLDSTKDLSDAQIGRVIEEMRRQLPESKAVRQKADNVVNFPDPKTNREQSFGNAANNVVQFKNNKSGESQHFTIQKLFDYLGWAVERRDEWLRERFETAIIPDLTFKKANSLIFILLRIAASGDLKSKGMPTNTKAITKHIKLIKKRLQIGD